MAMRMFVCFLAALPTACWSRVVGPEIPPGSTDRLVEFSWRTFGANTTAKNATFRRHRLHEEAKELLDRIAPLYDGVAGEQWLVGCFGWLADLVFEWNGDPAQAYPLVNKDTPQWSAENATYDDIRQLVDTIREAARARGLVDLKVAALFTGWGHIYNVEAGPFHTRHPELHDGKMMTLRHDRTLNPDRYPYAAQPNGAIEGQPWPELWGKQWGNLSRFIGFDGIVIRDGFSTYTNYDRTGPYGIAASPNIRANALWLDGFRSLFRETKLANPSASVLGYSQAGSAVGEWRVGLTDLEQIVADGYIDAWIDQSWPGAWQDVPTRTLSGLGWTHQLAYILVHRAQIEGGNRARCRSVQFRKPCQSVKHYVLHETFDAYEGWDTIHNVPEKLRWGIMAYNHAALERADGSLVIADGQYISWANSWSYVKRSQEGSRSYDRHGDEGNYLLRPLGLLTSTDIEWLTGALNYAEESATSLLPGSLAGPALVYDRRGLETFMASEPQSNNYEWGDEQVAMLAKYGISTLAICRLEDGISTERAGGYVFSTPSVAGTSDSIFQSLKTLASDGSPIVMLGRADRIHPGLMHLAGASASSATLLPAAFHSLETNGTTFNASLSTLALAHAVGDGRVEMKTADQWPVLISNGSVMWAQLNDWAEPGNMDISIANFGSGHSFASLANLIRTARGSIQASHVGSSVNSAHPISFQAFHTSKHGMPVLNVLLGSLESNFCGNQIGSGITCTAPPAKYVDVELSLIPASRMLPNSCWKLHCQDSMQFPRQGHAGEDGFVRITVRVAAGAAHTYELLPCNDASRIFLV